MIRAVLFDMYETLCSHYRCPLYFGAQMADDAGIDREVFLPLWRDAAREEARTLGEMSLEALLEYILPRCGIIEENQLAAAIRQLCRKRSQTKRDCLRNLHPEILPMLRSLKAQGIKLAVVSNCYLEEAQVIRQWEESSLFDALLLSCEQGIRKPDPEIYRRCMEQLGVTAEECLFIGDGGSQELEAARALGMEAMQALWYMQGVENHPSVRKEWFRGLERPLEVVEEVRGM
ncbi:MAG: HAD-IIIA family hydrolase [Clostridia bacterium]|nr:HAD-IIIA family hydrolase [Clostridia bacterium]